MILQECKKNKFLSLLTIFVIVFVMYLIYKSIVGVEVMCILDCGPAEIVYGFEAISELIKQFMLFGLALFPICFPVIIIFICLYFIKKNKKY